MTGTSSWSNIFIAKMSSTGQRLWAVAAGDTGQNQAFGIAVDSGGNSYVAGMFQ